MKYLKAKYLIFGFNEEITCIKLRSFYKKHAGKDVDFNDIRHYPNGFKLLCFTLPICSYRKISITEAIRRSGQEYIKFHDSIDKLIEWYENEYINSTSNAVSWKEIEKVSTIPTKEPSPLKSKEKHTSREPMITTVLSNGLVVRVPMENADETIRKMEENIKHSKKQK